MVPSAGLELARPGPVAGGVGLPYNDTQASNATRAVAANRTPGVAGSATGPASTSNNARNGAAPSRRRRSQNALPDGDIRPGAAAVSLAHTWR